VEQAHPYDDDQKQREEHAYELATYIHKYHRSRRIPLRSHVRVLAHVSDYTLDRLVPEVEYWLELFDWQEKHNS
jgi:hypothetical protein